jgi:hypothetical protein
MNSPPTDENPEGPALEILKDLLTELKAALNSLGGQESQAITDHYHLHAGAYVHRAADGYLVLRTKGRMDASKLLIRPAVETMIRIQALRKQPELLYRIAYAESEEDKRWFRPVADKLGKPYDPTADPPGWDHFEKEFKQAFPNAELKREMLSIWDAAEIAGLADYYNSHFRMYCKHTHGAFRAISGSMDSMSDPEDTRTMVICTFSALDAVVAIGGSAHNLKTLHARVDELSKQPRIQMAREVVG